MKVTVQVIIETDNDAPTVVHEVFTLERARSGATPSGCTSTRPRTSSAGSRRGRRASRCAGSPGGPGRLPGLRDSRAATRTPAGSWCAACSAPCA